eukprot:gnl/Chilomastix_cuspidata/1424.p1 GENE.gnl/Chilomastix_cuspidata/1424~~gnl/Chilomastix_cuspidata/1424.p1  ORF type:complete len:351 (-),score=163.94 gnl/Chilomastix_cuspidata/1424:35-961(-)
MSSLLEAERKFDEGEKLSAKRKFRKTKWHLAADAYNESGRLFRVNKQPQRAAEAYSQSARCYTQAGLLIAAAEKLELGAQLLAPRGTAALDAAMAAKMLHKAGLLLREAGKHTMAAKALVRAAEAAEADRPAEAIDALEVAVDIYEAEDRMVYAVDPLETMLRIQLRRAGGKAVGNAPALRTLDRLRAAFEALDQQHNVHRVLLAQTIIHLAEDNVAAANECFLAMPSMRRDEAEAACGLIDAYRERDQDAWVRARKHTGIMSTWPFVFELLSRVVFEPGRPRAAPAAEARANGDDLEGFELSDSYSL